jgi:hypothetical protein
MVVVLAEATFVDTLVSTVFCWSNVLFSFFSYVIPLLAVVMAVLVMAVLVMAVLVGVLKAVSMPVLIAVLMVAVSIEV